MASRNPYLRHLVADRQRSWEMTPAQHQAAGRFIIADDYVAPDSLFPFEVQVLDQLPHSFAGIKLNRDVANNRDVRRLMRKRFGQVFLDFELGKAGEPLVAPLTDVVGSMIRPRWISISPEKGYTGLKKAVRAVHQAVHSEYNVDLVIRSAPSNMSPEACLQRYGRPAAEVADWCARLAVATDIRLVQVAGPEIEVVKAVDPSLQTIVVGARLPGEPIDGHDPARVWQPYQILDAGGDYISTGRQMMDAARHESRQAAAAVGMAYLDNAAQARCFQRLAA